MGYRTKCAEIAAVMLGRAAYTWLDDIKLYRYGSDIVAISILVSISITPRRISNDNPTLDANTG